MLVGAFAMKACMFREERLAVPKVGGVEFCVRSSRRLRFSAVVTSRGSVRLG